jgi:hypothetical protein
LRPLGSRPAVAETPALTELQRMTGRGASLPLPVRAPFERLFNTSFAEVEVFTDAAATAATRAAGAAAMTLGRRIFFAPNRFEPDRPEGSALLAHELTHVVQQRASPTRMALKSLGTVAPPEASAAEQQAEQTETRVLDLHRRNAFPSQPLVLSRAIAHSSAEPSSSGASAGASALPGDNYLGGANPTGSALGTSDSPALGRVVGPTEEPAGIPQEPAGGVAPADVEGLASRVYEMLKDRLTTERERRGRWF